MNRTGLARICCNSSLYKSWYSKESERLTWSRYRNAFFEFLARTQNADGSWNGVPIGQVYTACCYLTILQLDNGVLPIYQR